MFKFRCARTGMLYPSDYVEQWGRRYGIGLGTVPVSEALTNEYQSPLVPNNERPLDTMFPVAVCRAQVDLVEIPDDSEDLKPGSDRLPVLAIDDPNMTIRSEIMRGRQRDHSPEMARIFESNKAFLER